MSKEEVTVETDDSSPLRTFREFFALERDVLVLSLAMFAFSLAFQMTNRFLPEYLVALGFAVYAVFPVVLVGGPDALSPAVSTTWALVLVFAFSGLRFAGPPPTRH